MSPEELRAAVQAEREARVEACRAAINAALAEHGCALVAPVEVTPDGRLVARPVVVARE